MWVHMFGVDYYLDERAFKECVNKPAPPWRLEEVVEIQRQMTTLDNLVFQHLQQSAAPDPLDTLRKYLDGVIAGEVK